MRVLMCRISRQMLCVVLLLPVSMKAFDERPPFDQGPTAPKSDGDMPEEGMRLDSRDSMRPPQESSEMNEYRAPEDSRDTLTPDSDDSNSDNTSENQKETIPTHVVSGVDTDFAEQHAIDQAVDTINAKSGGNWLLKRVWWEKTEEVYEQIKEVFNKIMDTRMQFISEYNKLNRSLDIFYSEIGFEQGPLRDLLSHAQDLMEKEEREQGYLDKKEQAFVRKLRGKERDLEQLKLDIKAIQELDAKLDEAFEVLFKQIDVCNQYEQKAWENFKEIARELNDKEARKLYYDTEGLYKDIQKVSEYISGAFAAYFNQTIQSAQDHTEKISSQMNALKNDGIDLVIEAEKLEKDEDQEIKTEDQAAKPKPEKKGWWYALGDRFGKFIDSIIALFPKSFLNWFSKEKKQVDAEYDSLKKEGEQAYTDVTKDVSDDVNAVKKEVRTLGTDIENDVNSVEKDLGISVQSKSQNIVDKKTINNRMPLEQHTLPAFPEPHFQDSFDDRTELNHDEKPRINPTLAPMEYRPVHAPQPRRSVTEHFEQPHEQEDEFRRYQPNERQQNNGKEDRPRSNQWSSAESRNEDDLQPQRSFDQTERPMNGYDQMRLEHANSDSAPLHVDQ